MLQTLLTATLRATLVCVVLAFPSVCTADDYDVYLLAGQSNMDGRGLVSELSETEQKPLDDAVVFYRSVLRTSDGWQQRAPGFSAPPTYKGERPSQMFGPELGFARSMLQAKPGRKLALIKGSKGGTSLRADWKPGAHFDASSQLLLGERYAAAMCKLPVPEPGEMQASFRQRDVDRPNVLFIIVDDLNDWVGCLGGNPDAKTPNLDRLAQQSVLFNNAHCQVALCYASRASFMTGMYASKTGIYNNSSKSAHASYHQAKHMPVWFREFGYRTMCMGKIYHNDHGKKAYWDEIGPKTLRWGPEPPNGRQFAKRFGKDAQDSLAWAALDIEQGGMPDEQIAAWGIEKLSREYDQPFFLSLGFYKPHTPMTAPKRYFEQFDRDALTLPNVLKDDLDDVPEIGRRWVLDRSKLIAEDAVSQYSPTYRRELVHAYHACVALVDDCIGQVLDKLDKSPYADNTIVVLCSDHGWHLGEKNHWRKWMPWEESTRSLLIVRTPKAAGNGGVCERTVGLIDIYPTLAELCELQPPGDLQGESFRRLLENPKGSWDRPALTSTKAGNHTVRSDRWRYIRYVDGSEELYDHDNDTNEWHNIAGEPSMNAIKKQHAEWIDRLTRGEKPD